MADMPFTQTIDSTKGIATIELANPGNGNRLTAPEVAELGRTIRRLCAQAVADLPSSA